MNALFLAWFLCTALNRIHIMEIVTENPGLQHISETIFGFLGKNDLLNCSLVMKSWKKSLDQTNFWFKKLETENTSNGSELVNKNWKTLWNNHKTWKMLAQKLNDDQTITEFTMVLIWIYKRKLMESIHPLEVSVDLAQAKKCWELVSFIIENVHTMDSTKILNNGILLDGMTAIHLAALFGLKKSIEELMKRNLSSVNQRNMKGKGYYTPLDLAAWNGHLEIVKFLADLTENPTSKSEFGETPVHYAACNGQLEIVQFLTGLTDTPLAQDNDGETPIHDAAHNGYLETVKFLSSLTENPNAANNQGITSLDYAKRNKRHEVVKFLESISFPPQSQYSFFSAFSEFSSQLQDIIFL